MPLNASNEIAAVFAHQTRFFLQPAVPCRAWWLKAASKLPMNPDCTSCAYEACKLAGGGGAQHAAGRDPPYTGWRAGARFRLVGRGCRHQDGVEPMKSRVRRSGTYGQSFEDSRGQSEARIGELWRWTEPDPGDGEPVFGQLKGNNGYYVAFSHSGATLGLIAGKLLAGEIANGKELPCSPASVRTASPEYKGRPARPFLLRRPFSRSPQKGEGLGWESQKNRVASSNPFTSGLLSRMSTRMKQKCFGQRSGLM
jgi:hypothetical protein